MLFQTLISRRRGIVQFAVSTMLLVFMVSTQLALAQPNTEQMKERLAAQTEDTIKQLALTAEQEETVRSILADANTKRIEMMEKAFSGGRDREKMQAFRADLKKHQEDLEVQLSGLLTDEQLATYKKIVEEQASRRGQGRRGGGGLDGNT